MANIQLNRLADTNLVPYQVQSANEFLGSSSFCIQNVSSAWSIHEFKIILAVIFS